MCVNTCVCDMNVSVCVSGFWSNRQLSVIHWTDCLMLQSPRIWCMCARGHVHVWQSESPCCRHLCPVLASLTSQGGAYSGSRACGQPLQSICSFRQASVRVLLVHYKHRMRGLAPSKPI